MATPMTMSQHTLDIEGWERQSFWGWDPPMGIWYAQLWADGTEPGGNDNRDAPALWLTPPSYEIHYRQSLAEHIASFLGVDVKFVLEAFVEAYAGHLEISEDANFWEPEPPLTPRDLVRPHYAPVRTYAQLESGFEPFRFPIFYKLLSLDEALATEEAAIESSHDTFGDDFDAFQASQLNWVRSVYAAGFTWGTAYSIHARTGDWSSSILLAELMPLSREQFEAARVRGWLNPGE
jgi:hypothetical protein